MRDTVIKPRWHTMTEVAQMLGFGLSETKMLVLTGEIRSIKVGHNRRIMPNGWTSTSPQDRGISDMSGRARANGEGSIYPYRNGYAAYVWVRKPNGRRARKYVYGKSREIVHDKWIKLQQDAKQGPIASTDMTVAKYMDYWLREVIKPNRAPHTYVAYEGFTRLYINPGLGKTKLTRLQLQPRKVQEWINAVARACQCCTQGKDARRPVDKRPCFAREDTECCEQRISARTLSDIRACLRSALSSVIDDELITKNVAKSIRLPRVRKPKRKRWTSEEARKFPESAHADDDPLYAASFDTAELEIGYQLQRLAGQLLHRETKSEASNDTLPLPDIAATALRGRLAQRKRDREAAAEVWQGARLMFTTRYGLPIEPRPLESGGCPELRSPDLGGAEGI